MTDIASIEPEAGTVTAAITPASRAVAMLQHPTLAIAVVDGGAVREVNAAWRRLFSLAADASVESKVANLFANPHAVEHFERRLQSKLATGDPVHGPSGMVEHALVRCDGTSFTAEVLVWLLDATGIDRPLVAGAIWQVRDLTAERELHRDLRDLADYHRELSRQQWDMTLVIDRKGRLTHVSPSVGSVLGHDVNTLVGEPFRTILDPEHAQAAGQWLRTATSRRNKEKQDAEADAYRLHVLAASGETHVLACRARNCFDVPSIGGMVIHARDITPTLAQEERERSSKARADALRECLFALAGASAPTVPERIGTLLDAAVERLDLQMVDYRPMVPEGPAHRSPASAEGSPPPLSDPGETAWRAVDDVRNEPDIDDERRAAFEAVRIASVVEIPVVVDGETRGWLRAGAALSRKWEGVDVDFLIAIGRLVADATARRPPLEVGPLSVAVDDAPVVDRLTGLPDRAAAHRWVDERVSSLAPDATLTMISLDLDRLRDINERDGHAVGDAVIARTGRLLVEVFGDDAYVARTGGDAFVIVLCDVAPKTADETVALLVDRMTEVADADDVPRIEASIGTARLPADAEDAAALWLYSELAMREAKDRGRGQAFSFNHRLAAEVRVRRTLDSETADALTRNEFRLFYQPQIAMATGKVMGLEALLRWQHPTRGLVLPNVFMETAIERGLIDAITKWVLGQVCEQIAAWRRAGDFPELPVAVNVAGNQFHDRRLPAQVAAALLRSGLPARMLVLDLTEQTLIDDDTETQRVVKELDRLGVRTSVGGFALGHGAITQLRQLHVTQIKLDRGFVEALTTDEASALVVATMIEVARKLKCQVIAEGVETREQFDRLRSLGCEAGQGFFFGAPLSPDEIRAFIENNQKNPVR